jgi:hypothetical protein
LFGPAFHVRVAVMDPKHDAPPGPARIGDVPVPPPVAPPPPQLLPLWAYEWLYPGDFPVLENWPVDENVTAYVPGAGVEAPAIDEKPTAKATNPDRQRTKRGKAIPGNGGGLPTVLPTPGTPHDPDNPDTPAAPLGPKPIQTPKPLSIRPNRHLL